jgi:hypothetical protein
MKGIRLGHKKCNHISKYLLALVLSFVMLGLWPGQATAQEAGTIPTFRIVSVIPDQSVTIETSNFPPGRDFQVMMGAMGTLGIGGTVVATTPSGAGGTFQATYDIPPEFHGASRVAIRLESLPFFAYNWFDNRPAAPAPVHVGIPTFRIVSVVPDESVTIETNNFPAGRDFQVMMGRIGTQAIGGTVVATTPSGEGGTFQATYTIPAELHGLSHIAIRLESLPFFAYNWFHNRPAAPVAEVVTPPAEVTAPPPVHVGIPTFRIVSVQPGQSVTIETNNFPPGRDFQVMMGPIGTRGVGGTVVATTASGAGGTFQATYEIPAALRDSQQIAIRLESLPFFAYNWFHNR